MRIPLTRNVRICRDEGHRQADYGVLHQWPQSVAWAGASGHAVPQERAVSAGVRLSTGSNGVQLTAHQVPSSP